MSPAPIFCADPSRPHIAASRHPHTPAPRLRVGRLSAVARPLLLPLPVAALVATQPETVGRTYSAGAQYSPCAAISVRPHGGSGRPEGSARERRGGQRGGRVLHLQATSEVSSDSNPVRDREEGEEEGQFRGGSIAAGSAVSQVGGGASGRDGKRTVKEGEEEVQKRGEEGGGVQGQGEGEGKGGSKRVQWKRASVEELLAAVVRADGMLAEHEAHLRLRFARYLELREAIDRHEGGIEKFARGEAEGGEDRVQGRAKRWQLHTKQPCQAAHCGLTPCCPSSRPSLHQRFLPIMIAPVIPSCLRQSLDHHCLGVPILMAPAVLSVSDAWQVTSTWGSLGPPEPSCTASGLLLPRETPALPCCAARHLHCRAVL